MTSEELSSWERIKEYFEGLPEEKRENMFYKRAVIICSGRDDPMPDGGLRRV